MPQTTSPSAAAKTAVDVRPGARPRPRTRLISPPALGGLAILIGAALLVLYPQKELLDRISAAPRSDPLTVGYLVNLNRIDPQDARTTMLLAEARLAQNRNSEALHLIAPLEAAADPVLRRQAMLLHASALTTLSARAAYLGRHLTESWDRDELLRIADATRGAGDPALRAAIYARLAALEHDPAWFEQTAKAMLAQGDYGLSARLWFDARRHARTREDAKAYFLQGLRTLQSGNLLAEAVQAAETEVGDLAQDEDTVLALVRLALASGRPDVAERWMKRILWPAVPAGGARLAPSWSDRLAAWLMGRAHAQTGSAAPAPRMRAYDERVYTFAYEVFLANGNLEDAWRIAHAAVAQRPQDLAWRERLARAAEWSRRPAEALEQWLYLAQRGAREDAWQGVLRLAPGLQADEALFAATRHQVERGTPGPAELKNLAHLYERLGRPREGVRWFEARYAKTRDITSLELAADLADRAGDRDHAIELNLKIVSVAGPNEARMVRTATLLVLAGRFRAAHDLLKAHRAQIRPEAGDYWDLLGDLAWRLQDDESATFAYRALSGRKEADPGDFDRLVTLLRDTHPEEAARLAGFGFQRFRTPGLMLSALEIYWEKKDLDAMQRLYATLAVEDEKPFARIPFFYSLRAQYRQARADLKGALADLERAMAIAPQNAELKTAYTWMLIDAKDPVALRKQLEDIARTTPGDPELWALQAAGWTTLGEPRRALPFHARLARAQPDDYLVLMAWADALEQAGRAGESGRVRHQAWAVVRKAAAAGAARDAPEHRALRDTFARLALTLAPADTALAVVRDLMRRDFDPALAPDQRNRSAAVRELVLSWAISTEQTANARAWLWLQYGRKLAAPGWAAVSVALAENDTEAAERLLADKGLAVSADARIEAARMLRRNRLAQTLAFEAQTSRPDDDNLHLQLSDTLLEGANRLVGHALGSQRGVIRSHPVEGQVQVWVTPRLRLALEWREASQSSRDASVLTGVPARDREARVTLRHLLDSGWVEAGLGERSAFAKQTSLRLGWHTRWGRRFSTLLSAARNERTLDSTALAIAGSKDELAARFQFALAKREYLSGGWRGARYQTQNGAHLGTGSALEWELGHQVRIEYPDLTLRLTAANYRFSADGNNDARTAQLNPTGAVPGAAFFVPQNSRVLGAGIGFGESIRDSYSRGLRPWGSFSRTSSSLSGSGYNALFGVGGSVLGTDQLSLYWNRSRGGGTSGASILEYGLRYEILFDRF